MAKKSTPPPLRKEMKKITVWTVCNAAMNVAENFVCEKDYYLLLLTIMVMYYGVEATIN